MPTTMPGLMTIRAAPRRAAGRLRGFGGSGGPLHDGERRPGPRRPGCVGSSGGSPVGCALGLGVVAGLAVLADDGQHSHGQQYPKDSSACVGDRIGSVEARCGSLRPRGTDQQCRPARPAPTTRHPARPTYSAPRQPGGNQPGGRPRMPDNCRILRLAED
jgi:hypothetical protein